MAQSKICRRIFGLVWLFVVYSTLCISASAQSYSVDWSKIAGGGGTSTGGVYSASGTVGQADAGGTMAGGQYSATGGFWVLPVAIQTTNGPVLTIEPAPLGTARVSWSPATPGFMLQSTTNNPPANWTIVPGATTPPVWVPAKVPVTFYRLIKAAQ